MASKVLTCTCRQSHVGRRGGPHAGPRRCPPAVALLVQPSAATPTPSAAGRPSAAGPPGILPSALEHSILECRPPSTAGRSRSGTLGAALRKCSAVRQCLRLAEELCTRARVAAGRRPEGGCLAEVPASEQEQCNKPGTQAATSNPVSLVCGSKSTAGTAAATCKTQPGSNSESAEL